ncbi:MAG: cytochrome c oxidase subunit II [Chloroherpetonaceae bacterium]|nr:cytochrome c oxidase subunit II [Chthonomonadaceae bacterium]MDW8207577.1 cytochrome c oxidase subunit II [Chloroherpetonaceae bacterium]
MPFVDIPFHPPQASEFAAEVDALYFLIWGLTIIFTLIVALLILVLAIRYRRGSRVDRSNPPTHSLPLELTWSVIPLILGIIVFAWGARLYADVYKVPDNAMEIYVIGKQWMWHMQHPNGIRENNELHVPVGRAVKLTMISQDVIHSFFVPAFRIKRDVLPGTYTTAWFRATKPGKYHLFCAEFCGTQHSAMGGYVYVMPPAEFQKWLDSGGKGGEMPKTTRQPTLAEQGAEIWEQNNCGNCHGAVSNRRGPTLVGIYNRPRALKDGMTVKADEAYLRESILEPNRRLTAGYEPLMPSYKEQLKEDQVVKLIAYIRSLGSPDEPGRPEATRALNEPGSARDANAGKMGGKTR